MPEQAVEVVVPASTANLGPGFDSIGMALNLFMTIRVEAADEPRIVLHGEALSRLPANGDNLILQVMNRCFAERGRRLPPLHVHMWSDIPLTRGLGSSAAAVAAGLKAANALLGEAFSDDELLQLGTSWEGHPDNIGASLYGGVVIGTWDGERATVVQVPAPSLDAVVAVPEYELSTERARRVLPERISFSDAVLASSRANVLTAALIQERWDLLEVAMRDLFHHPYRAPLIPGMEELFSAAPRHGILGIALSGAGPTLLALTKEKERAGRFLRTSFAELDIPVQIHYLKPWNAGAKVRRLTGDIRACTVKKN